MITFPFDNAVGARYIRVVFRTSIQGHAYMALGEISFQATTIELVD